MRRGRTSARSLVFGLIFIGLAIVASIPFGLGWLVLMPVMFGGAVRELARSVRRVSDREARSESSSPRRRGSSAATVSIERRWVPAFAGTTTTSSAPVPSSGRARRRRRAAREAPRRSVMRDGSSSRTRSSSSSGTSNTSSSCTCSIRRVAELRVVDPLLHRDHRELDQVGGGALHRRVDRGALGAGAPRAARRRGCRAATAGGRTPSRRSPARARARACAACTRATPG